MAGQLLAAFGGGMLSFISPCVLPLVPGYLSLMSGVGSAQLSSASKADLRKLVLSTLLFVAGFTVVFTAFGAGASALGQALREEKVLLTRISGLLVIAMGLFLAGFVTPAALDRERRFQVSPSRLGNWAPPVMGMAFAFGWTPCIGPVLATVLSTAATSSTLERGILLLLAYSLGLGVPFVASGVAFSRLTGVFGWARRHGRAINVGAGVLLVGFGMLLVTNQVGWLAARLIDLMEAIGLGGLTRI